MVSKENEAMGGGSEIKAVATLLLVTWPQEPHLPRVPGPIENATPQILAFYCHALPCVSHEPQHQQCVRTGVDYQSLYAPGLVKREDKPYIRGSTDAVLLVMTTRTCSA